MQERLTLGGGLGVALGGCDIESRASNGVCASFTTAPPERVLDG